MSSHYLKFDSKQQAIEVIATNKSELFWFDNEVPHIRGSHEHSVCLVGTVYHATGDILEDGSPELILVPGYHVNLYLKNEPIPEYLIPYEVFPLTPSCIWG